MTIEKAQHHIIGGLLIVTAVLGYQLWQAKSDLAQQQAQYQNHFKYHRQLVGGTRLWKGSKGEMVNYNLRSFDSGRSWVAVEYDEDWRMRIKGDAESLYPGLVNTVLAGQRLIESSPGGKLDVSNPRNQSLLKQVGFEIVRQ